MRFLRYGWCVAVGLIGLSGAHAWGDEKSIPPTSLPASVRQAADRAIPGANWTEATQETEGRTVTYEVEGTNPDGDEVSVSVDAAGRVIEVCTEVDLAEVPRVVKDALRARLPGIKVREVMSVAQAGVITGYYFDARRNGQDIELTVSVDGRQFEIED